MPEPQISASTTPTVKVTAPPPAVPDGEDKKLEVGGSAVAIPLSGQSIGAPNSQPVSSTVPASPIPPSPPSAPPVAIDTDNGSSGGRGFLKWLVPVIILLLIAALGGAYWYVNSIFQSRVTSDHAEHMAMSPSVHQIMHIRQRLIVGTESTYQPMEFLDPQTNSLTGFDIDLSKEIAKEFNVPVEFKMVNFDSIFADSNLGKSNMLTNGDVDLLIDSVTITDARKKYYLFSNPYLAVGQVAVTKSDNTSIKTAADLKNKKIAVETSTSNEQLAETYTSPDNLLRLSDTAAGAQAVLDGKADAVLTDLTNAKGIIDTHPGLKIATDPLTNESYGIVISKDKADLQTEINRILDVLRQRGTLESLKQKWLE